MNRQQAEADTAEEFLSGKLAQVNVAKIEKELSALWKQAAHGDPDTPDAAIVRACSFNLILFSDDEDAESKGSDLLDEIEQHHPCRSILAIFRPGKQHQLNAWVSARCHTSGSSKQICSEQITVCCDGGRTAELASVVLPLVLPDLPVFLWWRKPSLDIEQIDIVKRAVLRLIFDSSLSPFEPEIFNSASKLIKELGTRTHVSDVNWRALQGWLHAVADAFDGFPLSVEALTRITRLTIEHEGDAGITNRGLLLAGWLASRLGWKAKQLDMSKRVATFGAGQQDVSVSFIGEAKADRPGHLNQVTIEFSGAPTLVVAPEPTDEARFIIARVDGTGHQETTRISSVLSETELVGQELAILGADPIFEQSVHMIQSLLAVRK